MQLPNFKVKTSTITTPTGRYIGTIYSGIMIIKQAGVRRAIVRRYDEDEVE